MNQPSGVTWGGGAPRDAWGLFILGFHSQSLQAPNPTRLFEPCMNQSVSIQTDGVLFARDRASLAKQALDRVEVWVIGRGGIAFWHRTLKGGGVHHLTGGCQALQLEGDEAGLR